MDSAAGEISSSVLAQASVEPKARPPNTMATPAIAYRRAGLFTGAPGFFLSLSIVLRDYCVQPSLHKNTVLEHVQDHFPRKTNTIRGILQAGCAEKSFGKFVGPCCTGEHMIRVLSLAGRSSGYRSIRAKAPRQAGAGPTSFWRFASARTAQKSLKVY
jgi:hypothetical protein